MLSNELNFPRSKISGRGGCLSPSVRLSVPPPPALDQRFLKIGIRKKNSIGMYQFRMAVSRGKNNNNKKPVSLG